MQFRVMTRTEICHSWFIGELIRMDGALSPDNRFRKPFKRIASQVLLSSCFLLCPEWRVWYLLSIRGEVETGRKTCKNLYKQA